MGTLSSVTTEMSQNQVDNKSLSIAGGGIIALIAILIKTSPKLLIAAAVSLNLGDVISGSMPWLRSDIEAAKEKKPELQPSTPWAQSGNGAPAPPPRKEDPALAMSANVFVFDNSNFPTLNAAANDYKKVAGTLARLQVLSLHSEEAATSLPQVMINGNNSCKKESSIGVYHPQCRSIGVDFTDGSLAFENDEEVIAVIAHEWGHHLANISGLKVSHNEGEIASDCFAGLAMGYLHKNALATKEEVESAGAMMIQLGNNSMGGIHPNSETRWGAFIGAAAYVTNPSGGQAKLYGSYCNSLDQILDKDRIRNASTRWDA